MSFGQATDADDSDTLNSQIVYGIVSSYYSNNFTIDPNTGVLRNIGKLDREAMDPDLNGRIELEVTATDKGTPPLSSMVTVIINVEVSLQQFVANDLCCVATAATPGEDDNRPCFLLMHPRMSMTTYHISEPPLTHFLSKKEKKVSTYSSTFKCS